MDGLGSRVLQSGRRPLPERDVLAKDFVPLRQRASVWRVRFHDLLWYTAATLLLGREAPAKVVSELLGHAAIAITLDLYVHVLLDMKAQASGTR